MKRAKRFIALTSIRFPILMILLMHGYFGWWLIDAFEWGQSDFLLELLARFIIASVMPVVHWIALFLLGVSLWSKRLSFIRLTTLFSLITWIITMIFFVFNGTFGITFFAFVFVTIIAAWVHFVIVGVG